MIENKTKLVEDILFSMGDMHSHAEKHFTPKELAELWHFDESTIRRMFVDEPGVLIYGKERRRDGRRDYVTICIPASVAERSSAPDAQSQLK